MTTTSRQARLRALGLVDWQLRTPEPVAVETAESSPTTTAAITTDVASAPAAMDAAAPTLAVQQDSAPAAVPPTEEVPATRTPDTVASHSATADLSTLDWAGLEAWLRQQDHRGARNAVFGIGARDADLLIVGEAPGAREDAQGLPFVGPAGRLLDRMLVTIGRSRQRDVYITNICKFQPPGNRDPHADEIATDWPVLERQIELLQPRLIVAVGRFAAQTLLGSTDGLGELRGRVHAYPRRDLPVIVTYHPAYLLRRPAEKAKSWQDLRRIAGLLSAAGN